MRWALFGAPFLPHAAHLACKPHTPHTTARARPWWRRLFFGRSVGGSIPPSCQMVRRPAYPTSPPHLLRPSVPLAFADLLLCSWQVYAIDSRMRSDVLGCARMRSALVCARLCLDPLRCARLLCARKCLDALGCAWLRYGCFVLGCALLPRSYLLISPPTTKAASHAAALPHCRCRRHPHTHMHTHPHTHTLTHPHTHTPTPTQTHTGMQGIAGCARMCAQMC